MAMTSIAEIETAISRLPLCEVEQVQEWVGQWIEAQREFTPDFEASIARGKADIAQGRTGVDKP